MVFAGCVTPSVALICNYKTLCTYISRFRVSRDVVLIFFFFGKTVVKPEFSNNNSGVTFCVDIHSLKRFLLKTQGNFKVLSSFGSTAVPNGVQDKGAGTMGYIPLYIASDWHMVESTVTKV